MPPIDKLLSQYSEPVRSWPGEEWQDEEARANYAAANPPKLQTEGGSIDKGDLLPIVRYPEAKKSPSEWQSSSDVMRQLDDGWRIEPFSRLMAPFKSMAEAWRTQPVLGPMVRPSQMNPEAFNQMSSDAMTVAGTGMTGGIGRAAVGHALPAGTAELGIFGGRKAKTADLDALARAEEMARVGTPREEIWSQTGWFSGPDGKWRFEIDDSGSAYKGRIAGKGMSGSLDSMFEHPSMYDAYPEMGAIPLETARGGTGGSYSAAGPGFPERIGATSETPERMRSLILHEAQHGVQSREGFAPGANPDVGHLRADVEVAAREAYEANRNRAPDADDELLAELGIKPRDTSKPWDELTDRQKMEWWESGRGRLYRQSAGETEARAVQARQDLTPAARRVRPPWLDYDVPESQQIVRFGDSGPTYSRRR